MLSTAKTVTSRLMPMAVMACVAGSLLTLAEVSAATTGQCVESDGMAESCSLNGVCNASDLCVCDPGWEGPSCSKLVLGPAPPGGVYGYGPPFATTSWGGNSVVDPATGTHHLFVTEIAGKRCGLEKWGTHSTVVHATSNSELGPYTRVALAVPHQAHNPQALLHGGKIYIFHIGNGNSSSVNPACNETMPPAAVKLPPSSTPVSGSTLHVATSFSGPFTAVQPRLPQCNNPSPAVHLNGTLFLACTWKLYSALRPEGPWVQVGPIHSHNSSTSPNGHWEDPFLFFDRRGGWHILAHVWSPQQYPINPISGHAFSRDGFNWTFANAQPYGNVVPRVDGRVETFATLERPKLMFNDPEDPHRPTALFNGASPVWDTANKTDPCHQCAHCSRCKVTKGLDWTYTLGRPVVVAPPSPTTFSVSN